jgi:hypothetical protein
MAVSPCPNPLPETPTQTLRKANKQGELKHNQKQKNQPIDQNFKQRNNTTIKGKTCHVVSIRYRVFIAIAPIHPLLARGR